MDTCSMPNTSPIVPDENETTSSVPPAFWQRPLSSLLRSALSPEGVIRRFLSLNGGTVLYALSALSIVYGITQIIGPPLAQSFALREILPCVAVLNVYE